MNRVRQSNIELLRIILMLMIVVNHIISHGILGYNSMTGIPLFICRFIMSLVVPAVISFVLISGYFGIKGSLYGGVKFWIQCMEFLILSIVLFMLTDKTINIKDFALAIFSPISESHGLWFIPAYFSLYCVSPFLNSWLRTVGKRKLAISIVLLTIGVSLLGYLVNMSFFSGIWLFTLLYILGWWIRLYKIPFLSKLSIRKLFALYFVMCFVNFVVYFMFQRFRPSFNSYSYKNPIIILSGIILFLIFVKYKLKSIGWINFLALGAFPVYILHENIWIRNIWIGFVHKVYNQYPLGVLILLLLLFVPIIYVLITVMEKQRLRFHEKYVFPKVKKIESFLLGYN